MIKPKKLKIGDTVAVIATSSPADPKRVSMAEKGLKALGLNPVFYPSCYASHGHLSGTDEIRLKDLHDAFQNTDHKGIICLKGGAGAMRLLDKINYDLVRNHPKLFVGFSDVTALHLAFAAKCNLTTVHGPMALSEMFQYEDGEVKLDQFTLASFQKAIFESAPMGKIENPEGFEVQSLVGGTTSGPIIGGNLSLIAATLGTPYEIDTRGKILFLEETHEPFYVIDRLLTALALAGKFKDCNGIVLGTWTGCRAEEKKSYKGKDLSLDMIIDEVITPYGKPMINGLYAGHNFPQISLPLGVNVTLDAKNGTLYYNESHFDTN
ncbi:LD-carboxypeptidase [Fusibacter bizertensis]|uniref:LD-carboxypeptidase n=1 Tax=Fusibacter bizertensis TaxID=1488331 RepID=A0ABT6NES8_9FIRM|nr:LD-carboxypeptidase [Fusibacter bizertensis]MDH8678921.1 LD-carboxypeptidase [Fusibacter bizertensis]